MKTQQVFLAFCLAAGLAVPASADTFVLTDGTKLEGRILSDEGDTYLLEVQVTPTIKDERRVPKAEVERIVAERLDEKAFEEISDLTPTPDLLTSEEYERRIRLAKQFLDAHPRSSRAKEVQKMVETLEKEAAAVEAGGMKLNGQIVDAREYRSNAFELDARAIEAKIREHVSNRQWLPALRLFEEFTADFKSSAAYQDLLPVIRKVIDQHETAASRMLSDFQSRMDERKVGLDRMSAAERPITEAALAERDAALEARYQEERSSRAKWVTPHPDHKRSLEDTVRAAQQEARRLDSQRTQANQVEGGEAYREAWEVIHAEEPDQKEYRAAMNDVRSARLPQRYVTMLEEAAKEAGLGS